MSHLRRWNRSVAVNKEILVRNIRKVRKELKGRKTLEMSTRKVCYRRKVLTSLRKVLKIQRKRIMIINNKK